MWVCHINCPVQRKFFPPDADAWYTAALTMTMMMIYIKFLVLKIMRKQEARTGLVSSKIILNFNYMLFMKKYFQVNGLVSFRLFRNNGYSSIEEITQQMGGLCGVKHSCLTGLDSAKQLNLLLL